MVVDNYPNCNPAQGLSELIVKWIIRSMLTPFMVIISNSLVLVSLVELSTKKSCDGRKNQTNESDKTVTSATPTR
jgi:hypothetical protein